MPFLTFNLAIAIPFYPVMPEGFVAGEQEATALSDVLPLDDAVTLSDRGGTRTRIIRSRSIRRLRHRPKVFNLAARARTLRRGISEESRDADPPLRGTLWFGATPPLREVSYSGRFSVPAFPR